MKSLFTLSLFLATFSTSVYAEGQISSSRVVELRCTAENKNGDKIEFAREGKVIVATAEGKTKEMLVSNLGNSPELRAGFLNLVSTTENAYVSFVFPSQELRTGKQSVKGEVYTRVIRNAFTPVIGLGTFFGTGTCELEISGR